MKLELRDPHAAQPGGTGREGSRTGTVVPSKLRLQGMLRRDVEVEPFISRLFWTFYIVDTCPELGAREGGLSVAGYFYMALRMEKGKSSEKCSRKEGLPCHVGPRGCAGTTCPAENQLPTVLSC